jgi:hypothetical protein
MATSGALAYQALQNVPLSTALPTNGLALLFLIWHVCPGDTGNPDLDPVDVWKKAGPGP